MLSPSDFNNAVPQFTNGNYASNPINPQYIAEPDAESYNRGTEPLQTLPAQWWNWFVNKFTARFNKVNIYVKNIFNELAQVLSIFNITPDGTEQTPTTSQLKTVFETCYPQYVKTQTTGTAVGCIPTVGTALGTTNNNILVTDSTGKLKPSGITVGTAAGCDATLFARKTEVDALYGNTVGTVLGTAAVGTCTTFARSDHVHPVTGLATTYVDSSTYPGIGNAGDYSGFLRLPQGGLLPYAADETNGYGQIGSSYWPFAAVYAKNFYGTLHGNADTASYALQATGPIPFDAAEETHPLGACVRAVVTKGTTEAIGYRSRMAIGLMYCGAWAHGLISVGCNDDGTAWDDFIFPVGHGGTVVTSTTIGGYTAGGAVCANQLSISGAGYSTWNWSGQNGQPSWLWGSNDGVNMYVWNPANFSVNYASCSGQATNVAGEYHGQEGLVCWSRSENTHIWTVTANSSDTIECDIFKALLCASNGDYRNITGNLNKIASIFGSFTVSRCTADCFFEADYMCITNDNIYIMNCDRNLTEQKWNLNTQDPRPFSIGGAFFNFY